MTRYDIIEMSNITSDIDDKIGGRLDYEENYDDRDVDYSADAGLPVRFHG